MVEEKSTKKALVYYECRNTAKTLRKYPLLHQKHIPDAAEERE